MLILAGVVISLVLSNNGVISKSKDAKGQYSQAQANEQGQLDEAADWIVQEVSDDDGGAKVDLSQYNIGDYVDYKPALETETDESKKTYTLTSDKSGLNNAQTVKYESGLKWRILNKNEDTGKIDIVAEPTTATVRFYGAKGYNNGVYALNDICEQLYSDKSKGIKARSINLADMERNLTPDGFNARNIENSSKSASGRYAVDYGETKTYSNYYFPTSSVNTVSWLEDGEGSGSGKGNGNGGSDYGFTILNPDIMNAVDPYGESSYSKNSPKDDKVIARNELVVVQTHYSIPITKKNYGISDDVLYSQTNYWIASRFVYADNSWATFGIRTAPDGDHYGDLYYSTGMDVGFSGQSLRPVVSLDARKLVKAEDDTKDDSKEYKIGDYVDYEPEIETSSAGSGSIASNVYYVTSDGSGYNNSQIITSENGLKWRILNIDEDTGKIDIVSDPTTATVYFYGATGYNNGVKVLNNICEQLYSNKSKGITARSINLEDIEKSLTPDGFKRRNNYSYKVTYGTTYTYAYDNGSGTGHVSGSGRVTSYIYYPITYKNTIGSGVHKWTDEGITKPDIKNTIDPYKESTYSNTLTSGSAKDLALDLTMSQTYYNISINPTNFGIKSSVLSNSNSYWVASRFIDADWDYANFGLRCAGTNMGGYSLFRSDDVDDGPYYNNLHLRAVVSLDSKDLPEKRVNQHWRVN